MPTFSPVHLKLARGPARMQAISTPEDRASAGDAARECSLLVQSRRVQREGDGVGKATVSFSSPLFPLPGDTHTDAPRRVRTHPETNLWGDMVTPRVRPMSVALDVSSPLAFVPDSCRKTPAAECPPQDACNPTPATRRLPQDICRKTPAARRPQPDACS
ncbi:hypothetical protein K438DRAFT_1807709 [Mycena galopus ATCC 62051]|nr:hypothetical protein K438DRAFT_1807709 [Mycena galopus ATCC 62051]